MIPLREHFWIFFNVVGAKSLWGVIHSIHTRFASVLHTLLQIVVLLKQQIKGVQRSGFQHSGYSSWSILRCISCHSTRPAFHYWTWGETWSKTNCPTARSSMRGIDIPPSQLLELCVLISSWRFFYIWPPLWVEERISSFVKIGSINTWLPMEKLNSNLLC